MIPDWDKLIGHGPVTLASGEVVTVQVSDDDEVIVALYAIPATEPTDDTPIEPAPVLQLTADEAELVASMVALGAATAHSRRNH